MRNHRRKTSKDMVLKKNNVANYQYRKILICLNACYTFILFLLFMVSQIEITNRN